MAGARVYIGNLPVDTDFLDLYNICSPYGQVLTIEIQDTSAFIDFSDTGHWADLIQAYNGCCRICGPGPDQNRKGLSRQSD